jgi:beta-lactamase regulating signal transducer with metallopeptidase domain
MSTLELLLGSSPMRALGWTLLHFVWQGVLLFAVHEMLQLILRRRAAAVRYVTSCIVLFAMLACAVVTLQVELQRVPVGAGDVQAQATRLDTSAQSALRSAREGATPPVDVSMPSDPHSPLLDRVAGAATPWQADLLARADAFLESGRLEALLPWMVALWFVGVFLLTTRLALGWQEARWLRTRAVRPVSETTHQQVRALMQRLRLSRSVQILESSLAEVPTVVGWLRPVILVPTAALTGLPPQHLEAILAHELSHVRRHDYLVNLMQTLVETMLFYHPAVWWVSNRIRDERENCCDDVAVQACGDAVLYARALTRMEELRCGPLQPGLVMAADGGSLVQRVRRLVGRGGDPAAPGAGVVVGAVLIGLSSLLTVSTARSIDPEQPAAATVVASEPESVSTPSSASPGGKIAGFTEAQPAPQLHRPASSVHDLTPKDPEPPVCTTSVTASDPEPVPDASAHAEAHRATPRRPVFSLDEIVQLQRHEVSTDYYDRMTELFGTLDVDEIVALKVHEIDGPYVERMVEQFGHLDVEEMLALSVHDVDVDYVQEMSRAFGRQLDFEDVVQLSVNDVDAEDVAGYQGRGLGLEPSEVASLMARDVDADDLEELQAELGPLSLEEGMALVSLGVDASDIADLRDMGMHHPRVDQLIHMYAQGLTAEVIDTILDDRMDAVPLDALVVFKELGLEDVFLAEFRRRNE